MGSTDLQAADDKQFILVDDNAATYLIRSALGGSNEDLLCGRLTVHPLFEEREVSSTVYQVTECRRRPSTI